MPSGEDDSANETSGEEQLIGRYFRPLATTPGAFALGDDAAVLTPPPGCDLVLSTDGVIAGVHFLAEDPPDSIARKVLRMNLSDLAAKGATPVGFLLSIALPAETQDSWVAGDAALGVLLHREASLAEKWRLSAASRTHLRDRYLLPQPRNVLAEALRHNASAAMDVSDGLVGDLAKLCRASGVAAEIDIASVPLSDAARGALSADATLVERILTGGDDYEILATLSSANFSAFRAAAAEAGVAVTQIGQVTSGEGVLFRRDGKVLSFARPAYTHF